MWLRQRDQRFRRWREECGIQFNNMCNRYGYQRGMQKSCKRVLGENLHQHTEEGIDMTYE